MRTVFLVFGIIAIIASLGWAFMVAYAKGMSDGHAEVGGYHVVTIVGLLIGLGLLLGAWFG